MNLASVHLYLMCTSTTGGFVVTEVRVYRRVLVHFMDDPHAKMGVEQFEV